MAALEESIFLFNFQNTTLSLLWRMVSQDQLLFTELFLDLWKDSLPFYVNKLEVNGTSGFHQDKSNSFQLEKKPNNSLIKFTILWSLTTTASTLITLEINWPRRSETLNLKDTTSLVLLVQNNVKTIKSTWEREIKKSQLVNLTLLDCYKCSQNWDHQRARRESKLKERHLNFEQMIKKIFISDLLFIVSNLLNWPNLNNLARYHRYL